MTGGTETELLTLNQKLLDAVDGRDWETYTALCDETLTAFEPEAVGNLVVGMPFHRFYFEMEGNRRPKQSTICSPSVRLMGDVACVTYVRLVQRVTPDGGTTTTACEETRVWQKQDGGWKNVHFHRSQSGFVEL